MKNKTVRHTLPAEMIDMGGLPVRQALPTQRVEQVGPFMLLHHSGIPTQRGTRPLQAGVPPHPHRGFAPVTLVVEGELHHRDSLGNSSVVGTGGVQWIHAGRGIIHSERPSASLAEAGGMVSVIQLWINLPAAHKMDAAWYRALPADALHHVALGEGADLYLVAGPFGESHTDPTHQGPIAPASPLTLARVEVKAGATVQLPLHPLWEAALYVANGSGNLHQYGHAERYHLYVLDTDGDSATYTATDSSTLVLMAGKPLNEPVAQYGPFVMNTQTQILEAMRDFSQGRMGILVEE